MGWYFRVIVHIIVASLVQVVRQSWTKVKVAWMLIIKDKTRNGKLIMNQAVQQILERRLVLMKQMLQHQELSRHSTILIHFLMSNMMKRRPSHWQNYTFILIIFSLRHLWSLNRDTTKTAMPHINHNHLFLHHLIIGTYFNQSHSKNYRSV